jgi:hypothetical protein
MATNLQVEQAISSTAQPVKDQNGNTSPLTLSTDKVGIGTTNPTHRLTLGSGSHIFLPIGSNLYFGGLTETGEIGMRLFGGNISSGLQSGFIDVRAGTVTDGLIFRVDSFLGGSEQMRITAAGNVGIANASPAGRLHIGPSRPDIFLVGNTTANQDGLRIHYNESAELRAT